MASRHLSGFPVWTLIYTWLLKASGSLFGSWTSWSIEGLFTASSSKHPYDWGIPSYLLYAKVTAPLKYWKGVVL